MTVSFDPMLSLPQVNDWFLSLDHLYFGQPWLIGLKRFPQMASQPMNFYFRPIKEGATFLIDLPADKQPEFSGGNVLKLNNVRIIPQYKTTISLK